MNCPCSKTIAGKGTEPRGRPAASGRGVRCGWIRMDHSPGASPRHIRRFWVRSKTAGEQKSQVLQEPESMHSSHAGDRFNNLDCLNRTASEAGTNLQLHPIHTLNSSATCISKFGLPFSVIFQTYTVGKVYLFPYFCDFLFQPRTFHPRVICA